MLRKVLEPTPQQVATLSEREGEPVLGMKFCLLFGCLIKKIKPCDCPPANPPVSGGSQLVAGWVPKALRPLDAGNFGASDLQSVVTSRVKLASNPATPESCDSAVTQL